jgi:hypothetical protein
MIDFVEVATPLGAAEVKIVDVESADEMAACASVDSVSTPFNDYVVQQLSVRSQYVIRDTDDVTTSLGVRVLGVEDLVGFVVNDSCFANACVFSVCLLYPNDVTRQKQVPKEIHFLLGEDWVGVE